MQQTFKNSFKNDFIAFQMLLKNFSLYFTGSLAWM